MYLTWQDVFKTTGPPSEREDLNATEVIDGFRFSTPTTVAPEQVEVLTALARLRLLLAHRAASRGRRNKSRSQISRAHQAETYRSDLPVVASFGKNLGTQTPARQPLLYNDSTFMRKSFLF